MLRRIADVGRQLDDRRVQLGLQRARQLARLCARDERRDGRHELQRLRVDDPELLLDSDRQRTSELLLDHLTLTPCTGPPAASHA